MRIRRLVSLALSVAALGGTYSPQASAAEPAFDSTPVDEKDRARDAMKEGVEAYKAGDYEKARVALEKSLQLRSSHDAAGVLGQTYLALGDYRKASNYLAYCVDHYPTGGKRELLKKIQEDLAESSKSVLGLRVFSNVDGSLVKIDGAEFGRTPADRTYVEAGEHTVVVTHPDGRSETRTIRGAAGETRTVTVAFGQGASRTQVTVGSGLDAEPASAATNSASASSDAKPAADKESSWKWPVVITTGVVGAVGVGVGVGFLVDSNGKTNSAEAIGSDIRSSGGSCETAFGTRCAAYQDLIAQSDQSKSLATVGFVAGGTLIVASIATAVLWPEAPAKVNVSKDGMMISFGGAF
jgi:hypothetical protein